MIAILTLQPTVRVDAACRAWRAATDVNGIQIGMHGTGRAILGRWDAPDYPRPESDEPGAEPTFVRFATRDGREELRLVHYPGAVVDDYDALEVRRPAGGTSPGKRLPFAQFATERRIRLGMTERDLIALLGACFTRERKGDAALLTYRIADKAHPALKRSGMPAYEATYEFRNGLLARFALGFEMP
ncbi:hypothetical protein [Methylobacterium nonmethylotrophicum]|uniref:Uncharacterized protein n=1 Tax=Methylobacterium nonmethylotrophicum TaxID=1141884 RepID=A0A4Z0NDZ5_9HYPH|nr:hypothetical protein [Methylobacterium nonmethylotrophicum]TGD94030.1 hypothetical protein EU555_32765 [Methylobacterium nonmethylotrophicum]